MISIFFNEFIAALCDYEYASRTPEALDERTCLTLLNSLINPVANLHWHIKICKRVENKWVVFIAQQVMDAVLDYSKVLVTIQSYSKAQSYVKATWKTSNPKDTRHNRIRSTAVVTS